jgi:hypothetical protein
MLALPFYMNKRKELPEPRKGQLEYQLFEEMFQSHSDTAMNSAKNTVHLHKGIAKNALSKGISTRSNK